MKFNWISLHKYEDIKYEKGEKETLGIVKIRLIGQKSVIHLDQKQL